MRNLVAQVYKNVIFGNKIDIIPTISGHGGPSGKKKKKRKCASYLYRRTHHSRATAVVQPHVVSDISSALTITGDHS